MKKTKNPNDLYKNVKVNLALVFCMILLIGSVSAMSTTYEDVTFMGNGYFGWNISVWDLEVRGGQSIHLAGATFSNEGMFTSVDTDWGIHNDKEPTAFLGIYAHNGTEETIANLILEAGDEGNASVFNIIKTNKQFAGGSLALINEDGKMSSYVQHNTFFNWGHFENLTKDEYGNVEGLTGVQSIMVLNDTSLKMNGEIIAEYFIGDGSLLTNLPSSNSNMLVSNDGYKQVILTNGLLQYWDGTRNRFDFTSVHSKFYSPGGSYTLLDNSRYVYNDGTRNRLEINAAGAMIVSPNGAETLIVGNDGLLYNMVEIATVNDINSNWDTAYGWGDHINLYSLLLHGHEDISSPDGLKNLTLDNTNFIYNDGTFNRMGITGITTILVSPDGTENLQVSNDGILYNDIEVATINNLHNEDRIISPDTLSNITVNNSGTYINGYFNFGGELILYEDNLRVVIQSPQKNHWINIGNDAVTVDGGQVFTASNTLSQISDVSPYQLDGQILVWNATSELWENRTIVSDNIPGTVVMSVSWNANTVSSGEATLSYRKNHLRAFRLTTGLWSIENMGTNPLFPGDSADWVINSVRGGVGDPFILVETNIIALGQPSVARPTTMTLSSTSVGTSSNTGNLGSIIMKIRDEDGVVIDPTLGDAYATVKFTYIN